MKHRKLICYIIFVSCLAAECMSLNQEKVSGCDCWILKNQLLKITVAPDASGSIAGLEYIPECRQLTAPFQFSISKIDLLPDILNCNNVGGRMVLWGRGIYGTQHFQVLEHAVDQNQSVIKIGADYFQDSSVRLEREISLISGRSAVRIKAKFKNLSMEEQEVIPWENMLAQLDPKNADQILMPSRAGVQRIRGRGIKELDRDQLWSPNPTSVGQIHTAPARNWIARKNACSPLILAIHMDWKDIYPEGMFYNWQGEDSSPLQTSEIIFAPVNLKGGQTHTIKYEYLIFHGLKNIMEIAGSYGIDCRQEKNQLILELAVIESRPENQIMLELKNKKGTRISLKSQGIPAMKPGKVQKFVFSLSQLLKGKYKIQGHFASGETFNLLDPLIRID